MGRFSGVAFVLCFASMILISAEGTSNNESISIGNSSSSNISSSNSSNSKKTIHLLGLLPITSARTTGLEIVLPTMTLALDQINSRDDILSDYHLELHWRDTECAAGPGVDALYQLLYEPPGKTMIIGGTCSVACEPIARAALIWNLTHIGFACKTPTLSDRTVFPHFFRCTPSEDATIPVFLEMLKFYKWKKVALIHEAVDYWSTYSEELHSALKEANVTMIRSEIFLGDPSLQVLNLQKQDARIVFGGFYQNNAVKVLCEAYKIGYYGPKIVWLFVNWYLDNYWQTDAKRTQCTTEQILEVIRTSVFYAGTYKNNPANFHTPTISQISRAEAFAYLESVLGPGSSASFPLMPLYYDVMWAAALILNRTVNKMRETGFPRSLEEFTYEDSEMTDFISSMVDGLEFQGLASPLRWTGKNSPDRSMSLQQQSGEGREVVGTFMIGVDDGIHWTERGVFWEMGHPPRDSQVWTFKKVRVQKRLYILMCIMTSLGILCSMTLLGFNVYFRAKRVIKMSSPNINNVMLVGCLISYTTVFFNHLENDVTSTQVSCIVTLFTLLVGFSLMFGALFSKTWRIHVIMRTSKKVQKVIMKDSKLIVVVLGLVLVDVFLIVIWQAIDPFTVVINDGTPEESSTDPDVWIVPQTTSCESDYQTYFSGVLYGIQGIMLAFGAFLAWETRQVKLAALNDSKEIGMCIYNVLIQGVMGVLINLVVDDIDVKYGFTSATIIAATALTQGIIFVPKILAVHHGDQGGEGSSRVGPDSSYHHSTGGTRGASSIHNNSHAIGLGHNSATISHS